MLQILRYTTREPKILIPMVLQHSKEHKKTCPATQTKVCPGKGGLKVREGPVGINRGEVCPPKIIKGDRKDGDGGTGLKRALVSGKCRMGFIPEEWFLFLKPMTGVTGPYFLLLGLTNYAVSKEIYIMEHEYYLGVSFFIVIYVITTKFGSLIGSELDKGVDAISNGYEESRRNDLDTMKKQIADCKTAMWRAEGQKELMDAKKENIAIQLEAEYRERQMMVHKVVRRRMEYHVKQHWVTRRLKHKWMVKWILKNVYKGITPEFKKQVMDIAIKDLSALADKYEASAKK